MKNINLWYWIVTVLFCAFMIFTSIPDIMKNPEAMLFITGLGYPEYFVVLIGWAKVLGVIAILIPGYYRIKEWAYAGLFFDLAGALYSIIATMGIQMQLIFLVLPVGFLFLSYYLYHSKYQNAV